MIVEPIRSAQAFTHEGMTLYRGRWWFPELMANLSWKVPPMSLPEKFVVVNIAVSLGEEQGIFRSIGWWDGQRWFTPGCCDAEQRYFDPDCSASSVVAWRPKGSTIR